MSNPNLKPSFRFPLQIPAGLVPDEVINVMQSHSDSITDINQAIAALTDKFNKLKTGTGGTVVGGSTSVTQIINGSNFPGLGGVNPQIGVTAYMPTTADNGIFLLFGDAAPVAVTLNSAMTTPYFLFISNFGSSNVTLTPTTGTINQNTVPVGGLYLVVFDGVNWWNAAIITGGSSVIPIPALIVMEPDSPDEPLMIPGTPGAPGAIGPVGPGGLPGPSIFLDPDPPEQPMMIPGSPGAAGATGPAGPPGLPIFLEPDAPEMPMMIPGAPGPPGAAGATGPVGPAGAPVFIEPESPDEPMMIPGPPGTSGGGGSGATTLISKQTPSGTTVVTFSSISGSFTNLRIVGAGRSTSAGAVAAAVLMTFNSDTGANYANQLIISNGTSISSFQATGQAFIEVGEVPESGAVANYPGQFIIDIALYAGTTFAKSCQAAYLRLNSTTVASLGNIQVMGVWNNTGAITRIDLTLNAGNWATGSTVSLYGIS